MQTIPAFGQVAVLALGGWLALHGEITLGTFLAFCTYMLLITPPIRQFAAILTVGQLARAGAERIYDLLDSTPVVQDAPDAFDLVVPHGEVRFDHVTFGYTSTEPVLRDFDLTVAAGETVALVGSSGSGKSTVALMLPRFYDVHSGAISIDGVDVRDVHLDSLRGNIGVVFEDSFLFSDTLTANIGFGRPDATQRGDRDRRARGRGARVHPPTAQRLRHDRRRARPHPLRRPAPTRRARTRAALRSEDPAARRRDLLGRLARRGGDPRRRCAASPARAPRS